MPDDGRDSPADQTVPPRGDVAPGSLTRVIACSFGGEDGRRYVPVVALCDPRLSPDGRVVREVWKYRDVVNERDVAVKLVSTRGTGADLVARVERAGATLAADVPGLAILLDHQRIDVGEASERVALISQFIAGPTLDQAVRSPLEAWQVLRISLLLAQSVAALHSAGIAHCDLKPSNVILRASDGAPVIVDPGSARRIGEPVVSSSPLWDAPESITRTPQATSAIDAWSLGLVLASLAGFAPDSEDSPSQRGSAARSVAHRAAARAGGKLDGFNAAVTGLLEIDPMARQSVGETVAVLRDSESDAIPPTSPASTSVTTRRIDRRRASRWATIIATALGIGGAAIYLEYARSDPTFPKAGPRLFVYNKLTNGATKMREDPIPAALSTLHIIRCQKLGCNVPGTARHSGSRFPRGVCQTTGDLVSNGSLSNPATTTTQDSLRQDAGTEFPTTSVPKVCISSQRFGSNPSSAAGSGYRGVSRDAGDPLCGGQQSGTRSSTDLE